MDGRMDAWIDGKCVGKKMGTVLCFYGRTPAARK